jgi:hypothetical protein
LAPIKANARLKQGSPRKTGQALSTIAMDTVNCLKQSTRQTCYKKKSNKTAYLAEETLLLNAGITAIKLHTRCSAAALCVRPVHTVLPVFVHAASMELLGAVVVWDAKA